MQLACQWATQESVQVKGALKATLHQAEAQLCPAPLPLVKRLSPDFQPLIQHVEKGVRTRL